ncbi:MAG: hypothetical protein FH748_08415 [Balneolaceae bacterium]|nr:hypothetical protein [Balneolaceae bacterium]
MSRFKTIEDVWDYLDAIPRFQSAGDKAVHYSLDTIKAFCASVGNPQDRFPSIHVGGTNGKGTTSHILANIYNDAGFTTGLFTSPHLEVYNERVRVAGKNITDEQMVIFFRNYEELLNQYNLSYFEISTVLAFWYFSEAEVDLAIIEVGLGGRLDSTNIITPGLSVITSLSLDHQQMLGDQIQDIAHEKAGIIKKGVPVVVGNLPGEALQIIQERVRKTGSKMYAVSDLEPKWKHGLFTLKTVGVTLKTNVREPINKWNLAMAWQVVQLLNEKFPVANESLKTSLSEFKGARGRFEKLSPEYEWYFSGSHNMEAVDALLETVRELGEITETVLVFSSVKDKISKEYLERFQGFKKVYFYQQEGERAAKNEDLSGIITPELIDNDNFEIILKELQTELVIFAGSFYFYPIIKRWTKA